MGKGRRQIEEGSCEEITLEAESDEVGELAQVGRNVTHESVPGEVEAVETAEVGDA